VGLVEEVTDAQAQIVAREDVEHIEGVAAALQQGRQAQDRKSGGGECDPVSVC
jgi:hypothetical protein